jgi:hypothetical protein
MKLKDLPQPIRELAEKRIREQGNEPNEEIALDDFKSDGNFNWDETEECDDFWNEINNGNFDVFYKLNPVEFITKKIDQLDPSDLAKVAEYVNEKYNAVIDKTEIDDELLTINYLMKKHPELSHSEATNLLHFCQKKTISHIGCYGEGSIMLPLWKEHNEKINNQ